VGFKYSAAALTHDVRGPRPWHRELTRAELVAMHAPGSQALTTGQAKWSSPQIPEIPGSFYFQSSGENLDTVLNIMTLSTL